MDSFRPAVLIHIIAKILVFRFKFILKPIVKVTFNFIFCYGKTAALLEKNTVEFQFGEGILKILAEIGQIGSFFLRVTVIFPKSGYEFAVGGLGSTVIDKDSYNFLGLRIFENNRGSVYKQIEIPKSLCEDSLVVFQERRVA